MKFFEFGKENEKTLLLLHGVCTTWQKSFMPLIELAKEEFHVVAVALDGFNPEEPEVNGVSAQAEAKIIAEYIVNNFDGKIDIVLGESWGGMVTNEIMLDPRVSVHTVIADGYTIMKYPQFKHRFPAHIVASIIANVEHFAFTRNLSWLGKVLGDEKALDMLYTGMSKETLYNMILSMMPYRYKLEAFDKTDSYLLIGTKEPGYKAIKKLLKKGYKLKVKEFEGYGHGTLLEKPEELLKEIKLAYQGYSIA